jgi:hypothetical protein
MQAAKACKALATHALLISPQQWQLTHSKESLRARCTPLQVLAPSPECHLNMLNSKSDVTGRAPGPPHSISNALVFIFRGLHGSQQSTQHSLHDDFLTQTKGA